MHEDRITEFVDNFQQMTSFARLARYRRSGESGTDVIANYLWNIALSEALYPSLAIFEVSLRNALHRALSGFAGTNMWFSQLLQPRQMVEFQKVYRKLQARHNHTPYADKLVSELSFGFWVSLLTQPYHQGIWTQHRARALKSAFTFMPPTPNMRRVVHNRCNMIRVLRNRIMHHEPIVAGLRWNGRSHDLISIHRQLGETAEWINPITIQAMSITDRFEAVYYESRQGIRIRLLNQFIEERGDYGLLHEHVARDLPRCSTVKSRSNGFGLQDQLATRQQS